MSEDIEIGKAAPSFQLNDQNGRRINLEEFKGQNSIVLFFYPKNFTPVCTLEAIAFRDAYPEFRELGAEVIGVSSDLESNHSKFCGSYDLPYILLSDQDQTVKKMYFRGGLLGKFSNRVTFVIDKRGIIIGKYSSSLRSQAHVDYALKILKS